MVSPRPEQVGHVRSTVKNPCCALTFPIPEHVGHLAGSEPAAAPDPEHPSHDTDEFTDTVSCLPL